MSRADFTPSPRTRLIVIAAGVLFHLLLLLGLIRAFTPDFTARVADNLARAISVIVLSPEPTPTPTPTPTPAPAARAPEEQGAAAPPGKKATPKPVSAPEPKIRIAEKPAPKVAATGDDYRSGAREQGEGTGAGGEGQGTGAGGSGTGPGGGGAAAQKLEKIAGDINSARDYPRATRELREGQSVTIQMTVGPDGRASNCRIITPSPDAEADRITCRLAVARFRFRPRINAQGVAVPGEYRWRQMWWDPRD